VDRIVFSEDGLVEERTAYFDPTPLLPGESPTG
jgi:hypothetical protein